MDALEPRHIAVIGCDDFTWRRLHEMPDARSGALRFSRVLPPGLIISNDPPPFLDLLERAQRQLDKLDEVQAIISPWDFPATSLTAHLSELRGLPGPGLKATVQCEHKLWSRKLQRETIPEVIPSFEAVDPFAEDPLANLSLDYPFWIKPIKSAASQLGFRIESDADFEAALQRIRAQIHIFSTSFDQVLDLLSAREELELGSARMCIAERIIGGEQMTIEGYVLNGEIRFHGIVDSKRGSNESTFSRYQYPSTLPGPILDQAQETSRRLIKHLGYNNATFNIEFFYDPTKQKLSLVEINPRISRSHALLFKYVDGLANLAEMTYVALGEAPPAKPGGRYVRAAKLFYRTQLPDAVLTAVPSQEELEAIEHDIEGVEIECDLKPGQRLSDLPCQESYSFDLAVVHVGADSEDELLTKYQECVDRLVFAFEHIQAPPDTKHPLVEADPALLD